MIAIHAKARNQFKKSKLRWRVSGGSKRSLGFIPFKSRAATWKNGQVKFAGRLFNVWDSYGLAQRANNKKCVKAIHAKIKNRRKDSVHKFSLQLVNNHAAIFVGNVSSSKLAKTKMAKSALDAGWAMLKIQLINAAKNILAAGHCRLAVGIPLL